MQTEETPAGVKIQGYEPLVSSTIRGGAAVFAGLICVAVAGFIVFVAWGNPPRSWPKPSVPHWVLGVTGVGVFGLPGLGVLLLGIADLIAAGRRKGLQARHADEPWKWDYGWRQDAAEDVSLKQVLRGVCAVGMAVAILVPIHLVAAGKAPWPVFVGLGFFDLLILMSFGTVLYRLAVQLKFGKARLRPATFPLRLGERAVLRWQPGQAEAALESLTVKLQCVQERYRSHREASSSAEGSTTVVNLDGYEMHGESVELPTPSEVRGRVAGGATFEFDLPANAALSTRLSDYPMRYWQIEMTGKGPGLDYQKRYILPVY